jgi:hypothetical protein
VHFPRWQLIYRSVDSGSFDSNITIFKNLPWKKDIFGKFTMKMRNFGKFTMSFWKI